LAKARSLNRGSKILTRLGAAATPTATPTPTPTLIVQVGKMDSGMASGKETLVLKGLDASRRNIDDFLTYFPATEIDQAKSKIAAENKLNVDEFDPLLGKPLNLPPPAGKV
jgi:hypothetical protein